MNVRELLRQRPWIWIVLLLGAMVIANLALVWVAMRHPVVSVKGE